MAICEQLGNHFNLWVPNSGVNNLHTSVDPVEVVGGDRPIRTQDYFLQRFQSDKPGKPGSETVEDVKAFVDRRQMCVLTVRQFRWTHSDYFFRFRRLSKAIEQLEKYYPDQFSDIYCSFCRSNVFAEDTELADFKLGDLQILTATPIAGTGRA